MAPIDTLLSLDMGLYDCLYRFRRDFEATSTVVYVHVRTLDIIAEDNQTYGPGVIKDLRNIVGVWHQQWTTLTVFREDGRVQYTQDQWEPHFLSPNVAKGDLPRLNVLDLEIRHEFKNRVSLIQLDTQQRILKICPFQYQLRYFTQEIKAYSMLSERNCSLIPRISSYVFERSEEQIIGFICELFQGRYAGPSDYDECKRSLLELQSYGIVHGDLNKFNIIITTSGPRFFDLEKSVLDTDKGISRDEFSRLQKEELDGLERVLNDEEGWGKPWSELEL